MMVAKKDFPQLMQVGKMTVARYYNGGAALDNDADPNTSEPDADRVLTLEEGVFYYRNDILSAGFGGTSGTIRPWVFVETLADGTAFNKWMPAASATQTLTNGANAAFSIIGSRSKKCFIQLVANTGLTEMVYGFL
jgi:hypothetical protein